MASTPTLHMLSLNPRALRVMQEQERFNWFARGLEARLGSYSLQYALDKLYDPTPSWPAQREKALVLLALLGTEAAGEAIATFDPGENETLEVFHAVCADEWARWSALCA